MLLNGEEIGSISHNKGGLGNLSGLRQDLQGLGLGKKLYGETLRQMPEKTFPSDKSLSDAAMGLRESMAKNPAYGVRRTAKNVTRDADALNTFPPTEATLPFLRRLRALEESSSLGRAPSSGSPPM